MPTIKSNGIQLYYADEGNGEDSIVFSHSYLVDHGVHLVLHIAPDR